MLIQRKEEEGKEGSAGEEPEDESVSISHLRAHTHTAPVEEGRRGAMITYRSFYCENIYNKMHSNEATIDNILLFVHLGG